VARTRPATASKRAARQGALNFLSGS
jgi:hypothetical protein